MPGQVAHRQPVGVGGHQAQAARLGGHSTPVRIGRESSVLAAGTTWRSASAKSAAASVTASPVGSGSRGNSSAGISRTANCERPDGDARLVVVDLDADRAGLERPHDVGDEPGRHDRDAVLVAGRP